MPMENIWNVFATKNIENFPNTLWSLKFKVLKHLKSKYIFSLRSYFNFREVEKQKLEKISKFF